MNGSNRKHENDTLFPDGDAVGVCKKHVTFRLAEDDLSKIDRIQQVLSPFAEDRTSTLRVIIRIVWALIFTPGTLTEVVAVLQRLQSHTSAHSQIPFHFPPHSHEPTFFPRISAQKEIA